MCIRDRDIISKDLKYEIVYVTEETLNHSPGFVKQRSIFYKGKIVLVDLDLVKSVEKIVQLADKSVFPVVFISSNIYQKRLYRLRKKYPMLRFRKISQYMMFNLLRNVCQKEGIKYDDTSLKKIINLCGSDVRSTLICLEGLKLDGVNEKTVKDLAECRDFDIFEILSAVFGDDFNRAREMINLYDQNILPWIESNIKDVKSLNAYKHLAKADLFSSRIRKRQSWGLLKYYYDHLAAISTLKLNKVRFNPPYITKRKKS